MPTIEQYLGEITPKKSGGIGVPVPKPAANIPTTQQSSTTKRKTSAKDILNILGWVGKTTRADRMLYERDLGRKPWTTMDYLTMMGYKNKYPKLTGAPSVDSELQRMYISNDLDPAIRELLYPSGAGSFINTVGLEGMESAAARERAEMAANPGSVTTLQRFYELHGTNDLQSIYEAYGAENIQDIYDFYGVQTMSDLYGLFDEGGDSAGGWSGYGGGWGGSAWGGSNYQSPKWWNPMVTWIMGMREHGKMQQAVPTPST